MQIIRSIQNRIYEIRRERVMLDFDLADLYEVPTKVLNQAVKRNIKRFPEDFMFRLTQQEWNNIRSQIVTTSEEVSENLRAIRSQSVTASQLKEIKERIGEHDAQLNQIYDAMENLLDEKAAERKWNERERIGFKK
ncbi:MAG TPA: ORF6N domain-containing protein [Parafilimonas sp.]